MGRERGEPPAFLAEDLYEVLTFFGPKFGRAIYIYITIRVTRVAIYFIYNMRKDSSPEYQERVEYFQDIEKTEL